MHTKTHHKLIHEGKYIAEVSVEYIHNEVDDWSPYLSLDDVLKLDTVREALRKNDIQTAKKFAKVYQIAEVAA